MTGPAAGVALLEQLEPGGSYADAVTRLLAVVRTQLGMSCAWASEFVDEQQVLRFVDADPGYAAPVAGSALPLSGSYCARVLDGRFPEVIPDTRAVPEAALLDVTAHLGIGAYVGVPLVGRAGIVDGMLCAVDEGPVPALGPRDADALRLVAGLLHDLQRRALDAAEVQAERERVVGALRDVIAGTGRYAVLQPVVEIATGRVVCAEGLTRFTGRSPVQDAPRTPAQWFDDAARLELGDELELAAAASVLDLVEQVPDGVAVTVNLGPSALLGPELPRLLQDRPLHRLVLEVTEHARVDDYDALRAALDPWRSRGLRVAVDDAGAGYASLRHVLAVRPDLVKVDMALTRGVDADPVRQALLTALATMASASGIGVIAEGVETPGELDALVACGIPMAQGYLLARPSREPDWQATLTGQ